MLPLLPLLTVLADTGEVVRSDDDASTAVIVLVIVAIAAIVVGTAVYIRRKRNR